MLAIHNDQFDPVFLSIPENHFVREHVGKPPAVIARIALPADVNPNAVMPVFEAVYQLEEVRTHDRVEWGGVESIKASIDAYLSHHAESQALKARGGPEFPRWPSMATWDSKGRFVIGGVGSDSHQVRTTFDANGERVRLAVPLHPSGVVSVKPRWIKSEQTYDALVIDETKGFLQCPICGHAENYQPDTPSAKNLAHGRMTKHLTGAKDKADAHRELYMRVKDQR
jgi:hypothetical protein